MPLDGLSTSASQGADLAQLAQLAPPIAQEDAQFVLSHREGKSRAAQGHMNLQALVERELKASVEAAASDPDLSVMDLVKSFSRMLPETATFSIREDVLLLMLRQRFKDLVAQGGAQVKQDKKKGAAAKQAVAGAAASNLDSDPSAQLEAFVTLTVLICVIDEAYQGHTATPRGLDRVVHPFYAELSSLFSQVHSKLGSSPGPRDPVILLYALQTVLFSVLLPATPLAVIKNESTTYPGTNYDFLGLAKPKELLSACASMPEEAERRREVESTSALARSAKAKQSELSTLIHQGGQRTLSMTESRKLRSIVFEPHPQHVEALLVEPAIRNMVTWNPLLALMLLGFMDVFYGQSGATLQLRDEALLRLLAQLETLPPSARSYDFMSRLLSLPDVDDEGKVACRLSPVTREHILQPFLSNCLRELEKVQEQLRTEVRDEMLLTRGGGNGGGGASQRGTMRQQSEGEEERMLGIDVSKRMARYVEGLAAFAVGVLQKGYLEVGGGRGEGEGAEDDETQGEGKDKEPPWITYELKAWALRNARVREANRLFSLLC